MSSRVRGLKHLLLRPATMIAVPFLVLIVLGLFALGFLKAPSHAKAAKADLEAAKTALSAGDLGAADTSLASARRNVDEVQDAMQGIGGDIWSVIPILGRPVSDVRHLGNALDNMTSAAEIAVKTWPTVNGDKATLLAERSIDVPTLNGLVQAVSDVSMHLDTAQLELREVRDSSLGVGTQLSEARDEALAAVSPLAATARRTAPLTDALPDLLGARGQRTYLLTLLNPSEQRFSGGAPLTVIPLEVDNGTLTTGEAIDTSDPSLFKVGRWEKVEGNPFHNGKLRISTSTFAPDWSVSGEELLRGWERRTGISVDGLVAVDVVALADMLRITGPLDAPGYGELDAAEFTKTLIGDYDAFPDNAARKELNRAIVPVFAERLFTTGHAREKIDSLRTSAQGRHFALWMRDSGVQAAVDQVGLAGELSDTPNDYLAVFNQNTNQSKSDYWQKRTVSSKVQLAADGSAKVRMTISVNNDSPPYVQPFTDPRGGTYVTKWNGMTVGVFLPNGATLTSATAADVPQGTRTFDYFGRPYKLLRLTLPPNQTREAVLEYDVPAAADALDDGTLTYRLDLTPQGLVIPEQVNVEVTWPKGYDVGKLPDGWTRKGPSVATYTNPGLVTQPSFTITGSQAGAVAP